MTAAAGTVRGRQTGSRSAIVKFFKAGKPPVPAEETIEIYTFTSAADESKGGRLSP